MHFIKKHAAKLLAALALGAAAFTTWATVETSPQYPADLNATYPASTDPKSEGDDHIRNLKTVLKNTVAGFAGAAIVTGTDAGSANAYVLTPTPTLPGYTTGTLFVFKAVNANTGASTLNVSSLGTKSIKTISGADPGASEISGEVVLRFDGTNMVLVGGSEFLSKTGTQTVNGSVTFATAPLAPTAGVGTANTQVATTAFVAATSLISALPGQTNSAGKLITTDGANASWSDIGLTYTARTSNTVLGTADFVVGSRKFIDITSGTFTQTFVAAATLGAGGWVRIRNSGTGVITLDPNGAETIDGLTTLQLWPGAVRDILCDGSVFRTVPLVGGVFKVSASGAGTWTKTSNVTAYDVRITGSGSGGGGGGGGGSGRGNNTNSGSGGSGGSGGAGGQSGQSARKLIPSTQLPATVAYNLGAGGAGGTSGGGGTGATSGNTGNNGSAGGNGSAGNASTFATSTDAYYITAAGGAAGTNGGAFGLAGSTNNAGGAAITNNATLATASTALNLAVAGPTVNGGISVAGTTQTSVGPGTPGGAGGTSSATFSAGSGDAGAAGGLAQSTLGSAGNAGTTPGAPSTPGMGGIGGGGGSGSAGVGAGSSAVTGNGGAGGVGGAGAVGELEVVEIL